jgi:predicted amidohydrolase
MGPADGVSIRVGYLQTNPRLSDVAGNLERAARAIAAAPPFDVLVLPELFATGYLLRDRAHVAELAEDPGGRTVTFLAREAAARGAWLAAGFAERAGGALYNAAALVGPGGERHVYRKVHLFDRETELFDPGREPFRALAIRVGDTALRVGLLICFDWLFPEAARCLALDGADVLLHPSNLVLPYCQDAMRTRCLENRVFAVTANRCGADETEGERLRFTGCSQITGPRGAVLSRAPGDSEHADVVRIDLGEARNKGVTPRNHLFGSRRPELYRAIRGSS